MRRTALVLAAALWASAAHAQQSVHPKNVQGGVAAQPVQDTVCIVKGEWVKPCADPQSELLARLAKAPARAQVMHAVFKPHVIYTDVGGRISEYWERFRLLAAQGGDVEIRGSCESACTPVTSLVPKERLCFSDRAVLRFHKAHMSDGNPTTHYTQQMVDSYPADIRGWIVAMGGVEKMPADSYWTLPAPLLWTLGYRKCGDW